MQRSVMTIRGSQDRASREAPVLETHGLTRVFREVAAVSDVDLAVSPGRVYGLLGPNGAGKSTTLKMVLGLLAPSSGAVRLFGRPWRRDVLRRVGASIEGPSIYEHLSATQNLAVHRHLLGQPAAEVDRVIEVVGLQGTGRRKAGTFSTGMKGRLALAIALLGGPDLLILDEPQNGLDPEGIVALRGLLSSFTAAGGTVVLSSHLLSEVAQVADDVGVLVGGRLRFQGALADLAPDGDLERAYFDLTVRP